MTAQRLFSQGALLRCTLIIIVIAVSGCARTPPTRFFMLTPETSGSAIAAGKLEGSRVGIGPVTITDYLNRPQIVSRKSTNEINLAEFVQWAEPLDSNIGRVLVDNLSAQMPSVKFIGLPLRRPPHFDYTSTVRILRFDTGPDANASLEAEWNVMRGDDVVSLHRQRFEASSGDQTVTSSVAAQSKLLADLSSAIARSLVEASGRTTPSQ